MTKHYAYLSPDDDGDIFHFLTPGELKEFLENPKEYANISKFKGIEAVEKDEWAAEVGVLISFEILTPRKTDGWIL